METKKLSAFNEFMKVTLIKIKTENPTIKHTEAFKQSALLWKTSAQNPKNNK